MRTFRAIAAGLLMGAMISAAAPAFAIVVINEIVADERTVGTATVSPDGREFIELYNTDLVNPANIGNWVIRTQNMNTGGVISDALPGDATIAPGGYYVVAVQGREVTANHAIPLGAAEEMFPDSANLVVELRDNLDVTKDAIGIDPQRAPQFTNHSPAQRAQIGNGLWGQFNSYNLPETTDFKRQSIARYQDGRDTDSNGRDFGFLPLTPGANNQTHLTVRPAHLAPNVSSLAHGANVPDYNYGFVPVRAIDPSNAALPNTKVIPDSPRNGGRVMIAWDETGGGDSARSKDLVNKFDIYAYLDATPFNLPGDWEAEYTFYGIGTIEPLVDTPNPHDQTGPVSSGLSRNGATGIGWYYERFQPEVGTDSFKLSLMDFGQGGDNAPDAPLAREWQIKATFDLPSGTAGWHHLGIDYDPDTGEVLATFGEESRTFTTATGLMGNFYAGYREALTAVPGANNGKARPATFDMFVDPALPGDHNGDDKVDMLDYVVWRADPAGHDGNAGYDAWALNYGDSQGTGNAVPEPGAALLVVIGFMTLGAARRARGIHSRDR